MRTTLVLIAALVVAAQDGPAPKAIDAAIKKVTVYPDRALVTREARVDVAAGSTLLELKGLPVGMQSDSVRVKLGGLEGVRLGGVDVRTYQIERAQGEKVRELTDQKEKLEMKIGEINDRLAALASKREFIAALKATAAREGAEGVTKEKPQIDDWKKLAAFVEESLVEIAAAVRESQRASVEQANKHRVVSDELAKLTGAGALTKKNVVARVEAERPGAVTLEISYLVLGAGWVPSYDIHADPDRGEVKIHYYGEILQGTEEDWKDVELSLSTAHPARSATMPELEATLVSSLPRPSKFDAVQSSSNLYGNALQRNVQELDQIMRQQRLWIDANNDAPSAAVISVGFAPQTSSHVFRIRAPVRLPSDESPHKVTIASGTFKADFARVSTPKLSPHVYRKSKIVNSNDFPFMPGNLNIFVGNDFIGASAMEMVSPREAFEVYVGVDEAFKIVRTLESKRVEAGTLQKAFYTYRIKIENFKSAKTAVTILDQVPVSRDSDVEVMIDPETTAPATPDKDGKLTWTVDVEPGKPAEIRLSYRVYFPANRPVFGLD